MSDDPLPGWWQPLAARLAGLSAYDIFPAMPPADAAARPSAVLILFGGGLGGARAGGPEDADVLLLQRAATMRSHAGQPAFPGGGADPGDGGPVGTALREAREEVGLDPDSVRVVGLMPSLFLAPSGYVVTPVVAWWRRPHPVAPADPEEVASVERVPVAELVDPANRLRIRHPRGYVGPAFTVRGMLVWGFTAGLLSALLDLAGWARPWDTGRVENLPAEDLELSLKTRPPDAVH